MVSLNTINHHGGGRSPENGMLNSSLVFSGGNTEAVGGPTSSLLMSMMPGRTQRRRIPSSTRHSSFSTHNEAVSFFRADVQPLEEPKQKKQFFTLQKKLVSKELADVHKSKQELLHKSLQLFFKIHFMADKRRRRNERHLQGYVTQDAEIVDS